MAVWAKSVASRIAIYLRVHGCKRSCVNVTRKARNDRQDCACSHRSAVHSPHHVSEKGSYLQGARERRNSTAPMRVKKHAASSEKIVAAALCPTRGVGSH